MEKSKQSLYPKHFWSVFYFVTVFDIILAIDGYHFVGYHIIPLDSKASLITLFSGAIYSMIFGTDIRTKSILCAIGGIITYSFLFYMNIGFWLNSSIQKQERKYL